MLALHRAAQEIRQGRAEVALVLAVDEMTALLHRVLDRFGALAREVDGEELARPFDRRRNGVLAAEGASAILLERADVAERRGAPRLAGLRAHVAAFDPSAPAAGWGKHPEGLARRLGRQLERLGVDLASIDRVVSGAGGHRRGDLAEAAVLRQLWPESTLPAVLAPKATVGGVRRRLLGRRRAGRRRRPFRRDARLFRSRPQAWHLAPRWPFPGRPEAPSGQQPGGGGERRVVGSGTVSPESDAESGGPAKILANGLFKHHRKLLVTVLLLTLAAAALLPRLRFDTDLVALLPDDSVAASDYRRFVHHFGGFEKVFVVVLPATDEAEEEFDEGLTVFAAERLTEILRQRPEVAAARCGLEAADEDFLLEQVVARAPLFLPEDTLPSLAARLEPSAIAQRARQMRAQMTHPMGGWQVPFMVQDPLGTQRASRIGTTSR